MTLKLDGQWICFIQKTPQGIVTHKFRKIDVQPWGRVLLRILNSDCFQYQGMKKFFEENIWKEGR